MIQHNSLELVPEDMSPTIRVWRVFDNGYQIDGNFLTLDGAKGRSDLHQKRKVIVLAYREGHPSASLTDIAIGVALTRPQVHVILMCMGKLPE